MRTEPLAKMRRARDRNRVADRYRKVDAFIGEFGLVGFARSLHAASERVAATIRDNPPWVTFQ